VKLAPGIDERDDYVAGSPEGRAADLASLFDDPEVDVVHCMQGGYGSAQAIPFLDFEVIAENPKPFLGFSDITALHVAIRQRTGLATFYAPGVAGVGDKDVTSFTRERLLDVLRHGGAGDVPKDPDDPYVRSISGGKVTAPLAGGCLWLLLQTMATPWEIDLDGAIFFFEDTDAPPWYVDGMLAQLGHAGKLDRVAGVVVGEMHDCDWRETRPEWPRTKSIEDVLEQRLEPLGVPVLYKLPLGHGKHLATLPLGVSATLDGDARTLTIDDPALTESGTSLAQTREKGRTA
jgi:muramoyltetrapeptide carboxypeptidase